MNRQDGLTIIMVTHNLDIVADTDRVVRLVAGRVEDSRQPRFANHAQLASRPPRLTSDQLPARSAGRT